MKLSQIDYEKRGPTTITCASRTWPTGHKVKERVNAPLKSIAQDFGTSVTTIRTQLQAVFSNTGVSRQSDLQRLFISTVAVAV